MNLYHCAKNGGDNTCGIPKLEQGEEVSPFIFNSIGGTRMQYRIKNKQLLTGRPDRDTIITVDEITNLKIDLATLHVEGFLWKYCGVTDFETKR